MCNAISVGEYFNRMLDQSMNWRDAEEVRVKWGKAFCLKGIMSVADAKRAVDIGATGIMVSNHGGRQLDGSRTPFDQLAEVVDAVGDKIDIVCDGGIRRGTHVLKALSLDAKACSGGRFYLYALAAAGQAGVEKALRNLRGEIGRDMKLMGCGSLSRTGAEESAIPMNWANSAALVQSGVIISPSGTSRQSPDELPLATNRPSYDIGSSR
jgi:L-lactate dehydrogenase (cytochrome)